MPEQKQWSIPEMQAEIRFHAVLWFFLVVLKKMLNVSFLESPCKQILYTDNLFIFHLAICLSFVWGLENLRA